MRSLMILLALLAAPISAAELGVNGTTTAIVGETVSLDVEGEPSFDPAKTVGENLQAFQEWFATLQVLGSWPDGIPPEFTPDVDVSFSFETMTLVWDMRVDLTPATDGTHVVVLEQARTVILHRVEVGENPDDPEDPDDKLPGEVDRVTYVYEKDSNTVPRPVSVALNSLNGKGILASEFEQNTVDGDGQIPAQYAIALSAALDSGLPAIVFQAGDEVVKVIKSPTTEDEVLEVIDAN